MANYLIAVILVGGFIFLPAVIGFVWYQKSFIHKCWIAIQTGTDRGDVVWKEDRFKVVNKLGHHTIIFKHSRGGAPSPAGTFWTKLIHKKNAVVDYDAGLWKTKGLANKIQRGLFLYRTIEGEFHPMSIVDVGDLDKDGKPTAAVTFKVLSQDNRAFLIAADRDVQNLTLTGKKQLIAIIAVIIAIVILGICFILFLVYLGQNTDKLCGVGQTVRDSGIIEGVQGAIGG